MYYYKSNERFCAQRNPEDFTVHCGPICGKRKETFSLMRKKEKAKKNSVLSSYLLSYISIALLSCALIGAVICYFFVNDFVDTNKSNLQGKMSIAMNDLETQVDVMEDISFNISVGAAYAPTRIAEGNYAEYLMLKEFGGFQDYSPLCQQYFLLYENNAKAYVWNSVTCPTDELLKSVYNIPNVEYWIEQISKAETFSIFLPEDTTRILLCCPLRFAGSDSPQKARIVFICNRNDFFGRVSVSSGGFSSGYDLYYNDMLIYDGIPGTQDDTNNLSAYSKDGKFRMVLDPAMELDMSGLSLLQGVNMMLLLLCALVLVVGAMVLAYLRFRPIRKIYEKISSESTMEHEARNEILGIENALDNAREENQRINAQLEHQTSFLRRQIVRSLLNGSWDEGIYHRLSSLNMEIEDRLLMVVLLRFDDVVQRTEHIISEFSGLIEDLSDENLAYYCAPQPNNTGVAVLVSMQEASLVNDIEMIMAVAEAKNISCTVGQSEIYKELNQVPAAFLEAMEIIKQQHSSGDTLLTDYLEISAEILESAARGDRERAMELVDRLEEQLNKDGESLLLQRYRFSSIAGAMMRAGRNITPQLTNSHVNRMITSPSTAHFCAYLRTIVNEIYVASGHDGEENEKQMVARVMTYIHKHFQEYDLSLERLSEEFGLSVSHLSRLIKKITGTNYRDYVIRLKIDQAKVYLSSGISVSATNDLIGYSNISHFIKTFKRLEGVTPSVYQKNCRAEEAEKEYAQNI